MEETMQTQEESQQHGKPGKATKQTVTKPISLPAMDALTFSPARNGTWKADIDSKKRKTGTIRRALANVTFVLAGAIELTRTIWHERVYDRRAGEFVDNFVLTIRDRYNVDYPSEAAEREWTHWTAQVLAKDGPFKAWQQMQAELLRLQGETLDDMRPRLVERTKASDEDKAAYEALINE